MATVTMVGTAYQPYQLRDGSQISASSTGVLVVPNTGTNITDLLAQGVSFLTYTGPTGAQGVTGPSTGATGPAGPTGATGP
jgi:hypothetical protein